MAIEILEQKGRRILFRSNGDFLEAQGTMVISYTALTSQEITDEFSDFWKPFWQKDLADEQIFRFQLERFFVYTRRDADAYNPTDYNGYWRRGQMDENH